MPTASFGLVERLSDVHASARAAEALRAVAVDLLQPAARERLPIDDWNRLCSIVHGPVNVATERALSVLLSELEMAVREVGPDIVARLDQFRPRILIGAD